MPQFLSLAARQQLHSIRAAALRALRSGGASNLSPVSRLPSIRNAPTTPSMTRAASSTVTTNATTPLPSKKPNPTVRGVVFDMDGTLTLPVHDFVELRRRAGVPPGADILETIESIADPIARAAAHAAVEEVEREGLAGLAPARGLHTMLRRLDALGLPRGLVTRNNRGSVEVFHEKLLVVEEEIVVEGEGAEGGEEVVAVERETTATVGAAEASSAAAADAEGHGRHPHPRIHRDYRGSRRKQNAAKGRHRLPPFHPALARDFKPPKPAPAALLACAEAWGVHPSEVVMVGDSLADDIVAGNRAGAHTILLDDRGGEHEEVEASFACPETTPTVVATSLEHALELLESMFDLRPPPKKEEVE